MRYYEKLTYTNERGDSVELHRASKYHVNMNDVSGLNDIRNEIYSFNSMGQDGDTYLGNRIESREIEIIGSINSKDKDETILYRRKLSGILNPQLNATLTYEYKDFKRIIDCKVDNAPVFDKGDIFLSFTIQLVCLDPFWREENETKDDIASWIGNLEFPLEIPHDTGMEVSYREPSLIVNVCNDGDVKTGMRVDFRATGTITNPKLLNVYTGEYMNFKNLTMLAGEVLTVTTHYGQKDVKISKNGITEDAYRYWDDDGNTFIQLDLGDNLFRYEAETNADALEVSIYHTNKYLGV